MLQLRSTPRATVSGNSPAVKVETSWIVLVDRGGHDGEKDGESRKKAPDPAIIYPHAVRVLQKAFRPGPAWYNRVSRRVCSSWPGVSAVHDSTTGGR